MSDRLLASVIELEKNLQEEVRQEQLRAAAWQEREISALTTGLEEAQRDLESWQAEQLAGARQRTEAEAAALRAAAADKCALLTTVPESVLEEVLRQHLGMLLPEVGNDHPHGQG